MESRGRESPPGESAAEVHPSESGEEAGRQRLGSRASAEGESAAGGESEASRGAAPRNRSMNEPMAVWDARRNGDGSGTPASSGRADAPEGAASDGPADAADGAGRADGGESSRSTSSAYCTASAAKSSSNASSAATLAAASDARAARRGPDEDDPDASREAGPPVVVRDVSRCRLPSATLGRAVLTIGAVQRSAPFPRSPPTRGRASDASGMAATAPRRAERRRVKAGGRVSGRFLKPGSGHIGRRSTTTRAGRGWRADVQLFHGGVRSSPVSSRSAAALAPSTFAAVALAFSSSPLVRTLSLIASAASSLAAALPAAPNVGRTCAMT